MDKTGWQIIAWAGMGFVALFLLSTCTDRIMDKPVGTTFGQAIFPDRDY